MKVVHVIKRVETIDNDIKELRKLEKSIAKDKSFTTPIYMTIEKQINILLGERIKLLELQIENPPASFLTEAEGENDQIPAAPIQTIPEPKKVIKKPKPKEEAEEKKPLPQERKKITIPDGDIPMLTQDQIDAKFHAIKNEEKMKAEETSVKPAVSDTPLDENSIKLLDVALEKGNLSKKTMDKEKKVRFFRENFPSD